MDQRLEHSLPIIAAGLAGLAASVLSVPWPNSALFLTASIAGAAVLISVVVAGASFVLNHSSVLRDRVDRSGYRRVFVVYVAEAIGGLSLLVVVSGLGFFVNWKSGTFQVIWFAVFALAATAAARVIIAWILFAGHEEGAAK